MCIAGYFVQMGDAYGYGEFGNCLVPRYFLVCHDSWKRLSTSSSYVRARGLCLLIVDNSHHIGCDYVLCDFSYLKGLTF
jgi:hypothetical protein